MEANNLGKEHLGHRLRCVWMNKRDEVGVKRDEVGVLAEVIDHREGHGLPTDAC